MDDFPERSDARHQSSAARGPPKDREHQRVRAEPDRGTPDEPAVRSLPPADRDQPQHRRRPVRTSLTGRVAVADLMSILSTAYKSAVTSVPSKTKYVAVDPTLYKGTWTGKYPDGKTFSLSISNVDGFRAQIHYQSGDTSQYQQVLIKD